MTNSCHTDNLHIIYFPDHSYLQQAEAIGKGLLGRSKRYAMHVVDGEVKAVAIAESEFDPAGDDFPEKTLAPALIEMASTVEA